MAKQQRQNQSSAIGVVGILIVAIATTTIWQQRHQQAIASVEAIQSRITLAPDNGSNLAQIDRQSNPTVYYRVTLKDAPAGSRLSLRYDWLALNGEVVHQSRYQTQQIDRFVWTTYCYHQLGPNAAIGTWEVRMFLEGRSLRSQHFIVRTNL